MKLVKIGKTDVLSTPMGQGTNAVGGHNLFPNLNNKTGIQVVKTALDDGINMLDTAYAYGMGESEKLIGEAIKGYDRSKIVIATKGAQRITNDGKVVLDISPQFLKKTVEESLKRLQTNYIDIFYLHFPDGKTPLSEAIDALYSLKLEGKIKAIGVSNLSMKQLKEANAKGRVDIDEEKYNLLDREAQKERFPYLKEHSISFVPFFPLASGLLTGKYKEKPQFSKTDIRNDDPNFKGKRFEEIIKKVQALQPLAKKYGVSITDIVLAWYIKNPYITVVIPGAKTSQQVNDNAKAMGVNLSKADYDFIDTLFK